MSYCKFCCSIWPYLVLPLRARLELGTMAMKRYSTFPKAPALLKLHHQIVLCPTRNSLEESYPSAKIQSMYSAAPLVWGVLFFYRYAVSVFCNPSQLSHSLEASYSSAEMKSVYSAAPADWTPRWGNLTPLQRCSRCIKQLQPTGTQRHSLGESYPSAEMLSLTGHSNCRQY